MLGKAFKFRKKSIKYSSYLGLDRLLAIAASLNLTLVLFDLSYLPWRRYYFWYAPIITKAYDPVKGIVPNQRTQTYINTVKQLKSSVASSGLTSPNTEKLLKELRLSSQQILSIDPTSPSQKTEIAEKLKNRMRQHMSTQSGNAAFTNFWTIQHFQAKSWQSEMRYFDSQIQPLIVANYFRNADEYDEYVDYFGLIDLIFISLFAADIIRRIWGYKRLYPETSWSAAMRSRWYDIFLLLPFWRWLRILPVLIRLHQARFIDLSPIETEIDRYIVRTITVAVTREVVIQLLNQFQAQLRESDLSEVIKNRLQTEYVDINNVNEVKVITKLLYNVSVDRVLPKLQPQIESLLRHSLEKVIGQLPAYQTMSQIPGIGNLSINLANQLIQQTSETTYQIFQEMLKDPDGIKLSEELADNLIVTLSQELQKKQTLRKLQYLLVDMLEEIKINYIHNLSEIDLQNLKK